jgi:transcriptional regulator with XRE-family HTH domain
VCDARSADLDTATIPSRGSAAPPRLQYVLTVSAHAPAGEVTFGDLLRYWRRVRAMSQLDLASAAMTTPRHMSFLETGRSRPTRDMVLRLAVALEVPLRDRNGLLLAAGFAPLYPLRDLDDPQLDRVAAAVGAMLDHHEPLPAVVLDRGWALQRANVGAQRLFGALFAPDPVPADANVLRLMLEPGPVRASVVNWNEVAPELLERARREAVGGVLDLATADLVEELRSRPDVGATLVAPRSIAPSNPVIDIHFAVDDGVLRFFSVVSTIGTPIDVTAQELRVECFFPADIETAERWAAGV